MFKDYANIVTGIAGSYGIAAISFFGNINSLVSVITAVAGACMTLALAYKEFQNANYRKAEAHALIIRNQALLQQQLASSSSIVNSKSLDDEQESKPNSEK